MKTLIHRLMLLGSVFAFGCGAAESDNPAGKHGPVVDQSAPAKNPADPKNPVPTSAPAADPGKK